MRRHVVAVVSLVLAACGSSTSQRSSAAACDDLHPCASGTYCQASVCVPPTQLLCAQGILDCPTGWVCGSGSTCVGAPPPLQVSIVEPAGPMLTNGTVHLAATVTGGTASSTWLEDGGWYLGAFGGAGFDWDTASEPEGEHSIVAVAERGLERFYSAPVVVTVDRTHPALASTTPLDGAGDVAATDPVRLTMSEPIDPATFVPSSVTVTSADGAIPSVATLAPDGVTVNVALTLPATRPLTVTVDSGALGADRAGNVAIPSTFTFTYPAWHPLGDQLNVDPRGYVVDLEVDASSRPVVAIIDFPSPSATSPNLRVSRFEGGDWVDLGAQVNADGTFVGTNNGSSFDPAASLAIDPSDRPVVAYLESNSSIVVKRWNGTSWVALGTAHSGYNAAGADVAIATGGPIAPGEPIVFYTAYAAGKTALQGVVKRWDSALSVWVAMGDSLNEDPTRPAFAPSIAVDPSGRPVVAFDEWLAASPVFSVRARRWENDGWVALGGNLSPDPAWAVKNPDVAFDAGGAPLVAVGYNDHGTSRSLVRRWDGTDWATQVGAVDPLATSGYPDLSLAVDDAGRELVAYGAVANGTLGASDGIAVCALDGGVWGQIAPTPLGFAMKPQPATVKLAVDPASRLAVLAWCEKPVGSSSSDNRCFVRRQVP